MGRTSALRGLVAATHPGPAVAGTVRSGRRGTPAGPTAGGAALVVGTVPAGRLTIGWSNALLAASRDRQVGRTDKPLATGQVGEHTVRIALAVAVVATLVLSPLNGL